MTSILKLISKIPIEQIEGDILTNDNLNNKADIDLQNLAQGGIDYIKSLAYGSSLQLNSFTGGWNDLGTWVSFPSSNIGHNRVYMQFMYRGVGDGVSDIYFPMAFPVQVTFITGEKVAGDNTADLSPIGWTNAFVRINPNAAANLFILAIGW